jgi:hypothetical protein
VVDDNVGDGLEVALVQRAQALAQVALAAIGAVEAPQVARQVALQPKQGMCLVRVLPSTCIKTVAKVAMQIY